MQTTTKRTTALKPTSRDNIPKTTSVAQQKRLPTASGSVSTLKKIKSEQSGPASTTAVGRRTATAKATSAAPKVPIKTTAERLENLENELVQFKQSLEKKEEIIQHKSNLIHNNQQEMLGVYQEKVDLQNKVHNLQQEYKQQISELSSKGTTLENTLTTSRMQASNIKEELSNMRTQLELTQTTNQQQLQKIRQLEEMARKQQEIVDEMDLKSLQDDQVLKKLENTIQELKGSVRVFCRMRPLLLGDGPAEEAQTHSVSVDETQTSLEVSPPALTGTQAPKKFSFSFDKVLPTSTSQQQVFTDLSGLVQSVLDGVGVAIFVYGATGSGKTYTTEGNLAEPAEYGLIPRAVEMLFAYAEKMAALGWSFSFTADYFEIYAETLRDLLNTRNPTQKLDIKQDSRGATYVSPATNMPLRTPSQVIDLLTRAAESRNTNTNPTSPTNPTHTNGDAHANYVFQLRVCGENQKTGVKTLATLNIIELAGAERSTTSSNPKLHHSLNTFELVMTALANKERNIKYTTSKLTHLLAPVLAGDGKTLMILTLSPKTSDLQVSVNSLRFASQVTCIEMKQKKTK